MPATERPPSRLPNGKINPAYAKWRRENITEKAKPGDVVPLANTDDESAEQWEAEEAKDPGIGGASLPTASIENTLLLRVVKEAKNPRFVYCDLNGIKVPVGIKRGQGRRLMKKKIAVKVETVGEKTVYTHIR